MIVLRSLESGKSRESCDLMMNEPYCGMTRLERHNNTCCERGISLLAQQRDLFASIHKNIASSTVSARASPQQRIYRLKIESDDLDGNAESYTIAQPRYIIVK